MSGAFNLVADADCLLVAMDLGGCLADAGIVGVLQVGHFERRDVVLCDDLFVVLNVLFLMICPNSSSYRELVLIYSRED